MQPILTTLVNFAYKAFRIALIAPLKIFTILLPKLAIEEEQIPDYNPYITIQIHSWL